MHALNPRKYAYKKSWFYTWVYARVYKWLYTWFVYVKYAVESNMIKLIAVLFTVPLIVIVFSDEIDDIPLNVSEESAGLPDLNVRWLAIVSINLFF